MRGTLLNKIILWAITTLCLGLLNTACSPTPTPIATIEPSKLISETTTIPVLSSTKTASPMVIPSETPNPSITPVQGEPATLKVMGFKTGPEDQGGPVDQVNQKFIADFQATYPYITLELLETPPEAEEQLITELISGTAPDVWVMDAGILPKLVANHYALDLRQCSTIVPTFDFDHFFPNILSAYQQADGSVYGVPDEFSPMMIFYNPALFKEKDVPLPQTGWTWENFLLDAHLLTIDGQGRNMLDPQFDGQTVKTWGYRIRKYSFEWIYRLWENGGDVLSPDGKTAKGYLDSPQSLEVLNSIANLVLKYKVAPPLTVLDQLDRSVSINELFLQGGIAMLDRSHKDLVVILRIAETMGTEIGVIQQPTWKNGTTIFYTSGYFINSAVAADPARLAAACHFVDAATSPMNQDLKAKLGYAMSANVLSADKAVRESKYPEIETAFYQAVNQSRPPYSTTIAAWGDISQTLDRMMENILLGKDLPTEVSIAVEEIDLILASQQP